jgi:hypothetical protein
MLLLILTDSTNEIERGGAMQTQKRNDFAAY